MSAVCAITVTLDPESVYLVGRLQPLVEEILPEVRRRLDERLATVPKITMAAQVLGLSVAEERMYACLRLARDRLRDAALEARRQGALQSSSSQPSELVGAHDDAHLVDLPRQPQ